MSNYKNPQMDWQQVVLNGGPPCFAQLDDEEGWYCGRAERWEGHDGEHKFVSLDNLLTTIRQEERLAAQQRVFAEAIRQGVSASIAAIIAGKALEAEEGK